MSNRKKKSRSSKGKSRSIQWLSVICLLLAGTAVYFYLSPGRIVLPNVVGQNADLAKSKLEELNFSVSIKTSSDAHPQLAENTVVKQAPAAGLSLSAASKVILFVPPVVKRMDVPDLIGRTRSKAEDLVKHAGFEIEFSEEASDTIAIGLVLTQIPEAGSSKIEKGATIKVAISSGPGGQSVPDFTSLNPNSARARATEKGLQLVVQEVVQPSFSEGDPKTILRQEPRPGSELTPGSRVTVFIPIPAPPQIEPNAAPTGIRHAPRLEGLTIAQARKLSANEGLSLELADDADESRVISFQDPPPGDPLPSSNPAVLIRTNVAAVVPGLAGISEAKARKRIEAAGLTVGSVKKSYGLVEGETLGQQPSAGIEVVSGSQVDIVVADPALAPETSNQPVPIPTPAFSPAAWVE